MAHLYQTNMGINVEPLLPKDGKVSITMGPQALSEQGFNIPVLITSVPLEKSSPPPKSVLVMAHFDTGASITSIDEKLAAALELQPIGAAKTITAGGAIDVSCYIIEITFPNTNLKGYKLSVSGCALPYNGNLSDLNPRNFGVLLGRDIMANWNIVWNGPNSTVMVSD